MKYSVFSLLFICSMLSFGTTVNAITFGDSSASAEIEMNPEIPGPNQTVDIYLQSYVFDINSADITYKINGKVEKSGKGEKSFSFKVGDINTTTTFSVSVLPEGGRPIQSSIDIKPVGVDLVWQSEGFVPPFYKGKTLFSHQNKITFVAIPHMISSAGAEVSPKNLLYKWTQNGTILESDSGYSKNTLSLTGSLISRPMNVTVEVSSPTESGRGLAMVTASPITPSVVFYRKNPIYGIEFQKALTNNVLMSDSQEISVVGMPFFFGIQSSSLSDLMYKWLINGATIDQGLGLNTQAFRHQAGTSGVSKISLSIENQSKILQSATNNFNLEFGENVGGTSENQIIGD